MVNLTNLTNVDSLYGLAAFANTATEGAFWLLMLLSIFVVLLVSLGRQHGIDKAVAVSSFICLILSLFMIRLSFVTILAPVIFAIMLAGTLFYMKFLGDGQYG